MKIITLLTPKGGAGKTTTTFNLAVYLQSKGKEVLVIDTDPQTSATKIGDRREADSPIFFATPAERLEHSIELAKENGADYVFIDTRGESERASLNAAKQADLVLIPSAPTVLELSEIGAAMDFATMAKKPCAVILNRVSPLSTNVHGEAKELVQAQYGDVDVLDQYICDRAVYKHSLIPALGVIEYEPEGKAAAEIRALGDYLVKLLN